MKRIVASFLILMIPVVLKAQDLPCKAKFKNGRCKERYKEDAQGNIHGTYIEYDSDGKRLVLGNYNHGIKNGVWKYAEPYHFGESTVSYVNGEMEGAYYLVNSSLNSKESGTYSKGKKVGVWKEKVEKLDGKLVYQTGSYINGLREGKWLNVRQSSDAELAYEGFRLGDEMLNIGSTQYGYYTVYSKGKPLSYFDDKGGELTNNTDAKQDSKDNAKAIADAQAREKEKERLAAAEILRQKEEAAALAKAKQDEEIRRKPDGLKSVYFNYDSYVPTEKSKAQLVAFAQKVVHYNNLNPDNKITELFIVAHSHKGNETNSAQAKIQQKNIYTTSLNRAVMTKIILGQIINGVNFHVLTASSEMPVSAITSENKRVEIFTEETNNVKAAKQIFESLAKTYNTQTKNGEYMSDKIVKNDALRKTILYNIQYDIERGVAYSEIPLELWNEEYSKHEEDLDKFKQDIIKIVGSKENAEQFCYEKI